VLQGLWRDLYGSEPPEKISHQLMRQAIAHRLQIKGFGGLTFPTRRALNRLLEESGSIRHRDQKGKVMSSGTVLVRDWHGSTHQVTTTEKECCTGESSSAHYRKLLARLPERVGQVRCSLVFADHRER
jgi:hypothetical protein